MQVSNAIQTRPPESTAQKQVVARVTGLLMEGEQILASAGQTGFARWFIFPSDGVVVTNHRIFLVKNGMFSFNFNDMHWQHVQDVHLGMKMMGAIISAQASVSKSGYHTHAHAGGYARRSIDGLDKTQAQEVYRIGQAMENEWREHNRQRLMQERQVERGAYLVQQPGAQPASPGNGGGDPAERLQKLKGLADQGLISPEEFAQRKSEILGSI